MRRGRAALAAMGVALAGAVLLARAEIHIEPIVSGGRVLVSFTARDSWTLRQREMLQTGMQLTFEYRVELRRSAPLWFFHSTLARSRVSAIAKFDTLTGGYKVSRLREGRLVLAERRDQENEVREWLTVIERVELEPVRPLELNVEYYVQVQLTQSPRPDISLWSLWPFDRGDNVGRKAFPYIR
jgi:hypothetical protein